ncbi:MAG: arabinan endo-1,5-alpha-L-arabinosidase [Balneolaceae bacterium]
MPVSGVAMAQQVDIRVHDPVMIKQDSVYYLFTTGRGVSVWSSTDMKNWSREDPVFDTAPSWSSDVVSDFSNHIWAPDIQYRHGRYYLYYSVSSFGKNTSAIGVATTRTLHPDDPGFGWEDHGIVVRSVPGRDMWNAIDPNIVIDGEGTPWMAFGSFWMGIKLVRMDDNLLKIAENPQQWHTIAARERSSKPGDTRGGDAAIEAPFIFKRDGFYYLFVSHGLCCRGEESTYKVVVGRSEKVTGPYTDADGRELNDGGGTLVVQGNEKWAGVGHNAAYRFEDTDYLVFHGYDINDEGRPKLWIKEIDWDDEGWPTVSLN